MDMAIRKTAGPFWTGGGGHGRGGLRGFGGGLSEQTRQLLTAAAGTAAAFGAAWLLHELWTWTGGRFLPAAVFAAVNESVWEHVKILCWAFLFWGAAEYAILKPPLRRFITARAAGLTAVAVLTVCFFYIYSGVLGRTVVWVDIASAALWLLAGELVGMRVLNARAEADRWYPVAAAWLVLLLVMLLCFTASPPRIGLFADPATGLYGLDTRL